MRTGFVAPLETLRPWSGRLSVTLPTDPWFPVSLRVGFHGASNKTLSKRCRYLGSRKARRAAKRLHEASRLMHQCARSHMLLALLGGAAAVTLSLFNRYKEKNR